MGSSVSSGENRAKEAIVAALDSPLLNDNKITGAKNVLLLIVSGSNEITLDEIGEINDHIQSEAGHNANIIMGVGEDETLGDAIAVTIIATGFDIEQQNEIVNTEPKKIIHTLEDEQKSVHNLTSKTLTAFDLNSESTVSNSSERIVFELLEDTVVVPEPVAPAPTINKEELIVMSEFIKNLDVTFEIVSPITDIDFTISSPVAEVKEVKAVQPKIVERQEQTTFSFDLPLFKTEPIVEKQQEEKKVLFELTNETKEIKVNEAVQFVPVTELTENGIIKYSLEEYMELEQDFTASKPVEKPVEVIPAELNITMKKVEQSVNAPVNFEDISPMDMTIEETLRMRADERRKKLKEFNYKFHNNVSKIDEYEREPAYKRLGIDISNNQANTTNSRISVGTDSNNDLQLRSNNSYLHDNVD
jgi:cell division protein FtsZ